MPYLLTSEFSRTLFIRNHFLDLRYVGYVSRNNLAEISLALCGLLVENVRLESMSTFNLAGFGELKALFRTGVSFDFRLFMFLLRFCLLTFAAGWASGS